MSTTAHLASPSVSVAAGDEERVELHVRNGGDIVESYQLSVVGDGTDWITVEPATLSLYPGTEETATVVLRPPRSSAVRAGEVPYGVRVLPTERPGEVVVPEGTAEVRPFHELDAEVLPAERRRRLRARFQTRVANRGNTPVTASLAVEATSEDVRHSLASETITLQPGEETFVDLTVRPRKLQWFGTGVQHPFSVRVRRDGEEEEPSVPLAPTGTYVQLPLLPRWLLALLALLLALLALWYALALPAVRSAAREQADEAIEESVDDTEQPGDPDAGGGTDAGAGSEPGSPDGGDEPGGQGQDGGGGGSGSGSGGEEFATVLQTSVAPGESATSVYQVADDELLLITDIVADAPQGDTGTLQVTINDHRVTSLALENFRSHDNHWVTPIEAPPGSTIELSVTCRQPGSPPDAPAPSTCEESLFVTGTRVTVD